MRFSKTIVLFWMLVILAWSLPCLGQGNSLLMDESKINITGSLRPFKSTVEIEQLAIDRYVVHVKLHAASPSLPPDFILSFKFPKNKINQLWSSRTWSNKSFFSLPSNDRAAANFSIIAGLTLNDQNQITFTCTDRFDTRFINTYVQEKGDSLAFILDFFEDNPPLSKMQDYEVDILVDFRNIHFSEAIYEASKWRFKNEFISAALSGKQESEPVYSTWYPMHRNIPLENITRELDSLETYGFKSILIDDGWRSLVKMKVDTSYIYDSNSLKSLQLLNSKRSKMGMKLFFWYSLPFMGGNPVVTEKFEGKFLSYKAPFQIHVLDPRYPDVRQYLTSTYYNFFKEWKFDGFWFDFLNNFYPNEHVTISEDLGRDFVDVKLAVDTLMNVLTSRLNTITPNLFMGQKFSSVGPMHSNKQNFLAGFVGVGSTKIVREKMINNRLLYGHNTPFMEIMAVHPRDKTKDVARKFQSVMYGVPHLSFFTGTLPEATKQTIRFWLNYWKENYHVLMDAEFEPQKVANLYPVIKVESKVKTIYTVYDDYILSLPTVVDRPIDIINSKETLFLNFVVSKKGNSYKFEIFNQLGVSVEQGIMKSKRNNTLEFTVPEGGFVRIKPS